MARAAGAGGARGRAGARARDRAPALRVRPREAGRSGREGLTVLDTSSVPLLSSKQMAAFVAHGFLRFDELVPPDMAAAAQGEPTIRTPVTRAGRSAPCGHDRPPSAPCCACRAWRG